MTQDEQEVLRALYPTTFRQATDVAWTTKIPLVRVREILDDLLVQDLVVNEGRYWRLKDGT